MAGKQGAWKDRVLVLTLVAVAGLGGFGLLGFGGSDAQAEERLATLEAEAQQMDAALDTVEERLLGNQAQLQLWAELGRRHKQVSQVHTQNADAHYMARLEWMERMQQKTVKKSKSRRVASADTVLTSGRARRGGGTD